MNKRNRARKTKQKFFIAPMRSVGIVSLTKISRKIEKNEY